MINYKQVSVRLGLHKDSLNHISHNRSNSKIKKLFNLRTKIAEIEPVEEIQNEQSIIENDIVSE